MSISAVPINRKDAVMTTTTCANGHSINGPLDRLPSGHCRECDKDYQARYRRRQRAGIALLHAVEERGLAIGEALSLIAHADYATLQECQSR